MAEPTVKTFQKPHCPWITMYVTIDFHDLPEDSEDGNAEVLNVECVCRACSTKEQVDPDDFDNPQELVAATEKFWEEHSDCAVMTN